MKIGAGSKLLMIGDSITDAERLHVVAWPNTRGLGYGYVSMVAALLGATYPELGISVINRGIGGNTVRDLKQRWQNDVLDLQPDWLSIMIGINDVWRQFDTPRRPEQHVYIEEYTQTLSDLLEQTKPYVRGIILLTPYYIEPDRLDSMRKQMDLYGAKVLELSKKHQTIFVDVQAAFDKALTIYKPVELALDKVHPDQLGHMIIARAILESVD